MICGGIGSAVLMVAWRWSRRRGAVAVARGRPWGRYRHVVVLRCCRHRQQRRCGGRREQGRSEHGETPQMDPDGFGQRPTESRASRRGESGAAARRQLKPNDRRQRRDHSRPLRRHDGSRQARQRDAADAQMVRGRPLLVLRRSKVFRRHCMRSRRVMARRHRCRRGNRERREQQREDQASQHATRIVLAPARGNRVRR